jgi:ABC-type sugar transport system ATPase subunit
LREGGIATASLAENVAATNLDSLAVRGGWVSGKRERALAADITASFNIRASGPGAAFGALSGGNQQKALIARWLRGDAKVLLMHEPTAGVDIGSVAEILAMLTSFAARGGAVLIATGQTEDLAGLCDRLLVLADGRMSP